MPIDPLSDVAFDRAGDPGLPPPALCEGTPLATEGGEAPVEALAPGTLLRLDGCEALALRWTGQRAVLLAAMPPHRVAAWQPVRIRRGAIAADIPSRDILVSPVLGVHLHGVLVPAAALVNGVSIRREASAAAVRYAQPELARHAVVLAAGLGVESLADRGDRNAFANIVAAPAAAGPPVLLPPAAPARGDAMREAGAWRIHAGANFPSPDLRLLVDGRVVAPLAVEAGLHRFRLPGRSGEIRLLSRAVVPAAQDARDTGQRRRGVGLALIRMRGDGAAIELRHDHPALLEGFDLPEAGLRWTDGFALLPGRLHRALRGEISLEVQTGGPALRYPLPAEASRPRALVIDLAVPGPGGGGEAAVIMEHIRALQSQGRAVTFVATGLQAPAADIVALAAEGVELTGWPLYAGMDHFLALRGGSFASVTVHRVTAADRVIPSLRRLAPQARLLCSTRPGCADCGYCAAA